MLLAWEGIKDDCSFQEDQATAEVTLMSVEPAVSSGVWKQTRTEYVFNQHSSGKKSLKKKKSSEIDLQRTLSRVCLCMNKERDVTRLSNCSCYPGVISRCFSAIKYERCLLSSNAPGQAEMIYVVSAKANGGVEDLGWFQSRCCFYEFGVMITNFQPRFL